MKNVWIKWRRGEYGIQFKRLQRAMLIFALLILVLLAERHNISYTKSGHLLNILPPESFETAVAEQEVERNDDDCLIIWDSSFDTSSLAHYEFLAIAGEMKIKITEADLNQEKLPDLWKYRKIVLALDSFASLGEEVLTIFDYVGQGGNLLVLNIPDGDAYFQLISEKMGIREFGTQMYKVEGLRCKTGFMVGGMEKDFHVTDAYESSLPVILDEKGKVHMVSADEKEIPLIWEIPYKEGKVVVDNIGFFEKAYRGLYAASFSLLGDYCIYPVINGSAFYLDDFPSPVPEGESEYITRDYRMSVENFYTNIWWPDMCDIAEEYGIRHTGMVIEEYSDQVKAPFDRNDNLQRFRYFGNKLLDNGGEIGFHGYNHMPLVLSNFDYKGRFDSYEPWASQQDMYLSIEELKGFCTWLFPEETLQVYVPPSNILSEEGRQMLAGENVGIKAIASIYFQGEFEYDQDFKVAEDGIIETPRIISGCQVDDYMQIAAFSELNLHYVNSHFLHPDDLLDEDRGAELGWEVLKKDFESYLEWLYTSAPAIRNLTGSEMAAAVQRFYYVDYESQKKEKELEIHVSGLADEAWFMIRINEGKPAKISGGELCEAGENLYLLEAQGDQVIISIEEVSDDYYSGCWE